jgi:endopolyphosphatase
VRIGA